jgi:NAD(P) transhydrogenase subunit alpha
MVLGPLNLSSMVPYHASQLFATNITAFARVLVTDGRLSLELDDEIVRETLVTHEGKVVHPRVLELLGTSQASKAKVKA